MKNKALMIITVIIIPVILCGCAEYSERRETSISTHSSILRSRNFILEAVQDYNGVEVLLHMHISGNDGEITVTVGNATDKYSFSEGKIYQHIESNGAVNISETNEGQSLLKLTETLCRCPDSSENTENGALFVFSEDKSKLCSVNINEIRLDILKIEAL